MRPNGASRKQYSPRPGRILKERATVIKVMTKTFKNSSRSLRFSPVGPRTVLLMQDEATHFPVGAYRGTQFWIGPTLRIEDATFVPAPPAPRQGL
jgi:hypothetical protein